MCYAIPARILAIEGDTATVDYGGIRKQANVSLLDAVAKGDFVLVHAGFAIHKIEKGAAISTLSALKGLADSDRRQS